MRAEAPAQLSCGVDIACGRAVAALDPLETNQVTGVWTPPVGKDHIATQVSRSQGTLEAAVFAEDVSGSFEPFVFSSNVAANTFGPVIKVTDPNFTFAADPLIALNSATNQAVLAHATLGQPFGPPSLALVDLATGGFVKFRGVGSGDVNGLAVDSETGIACTTTEIDFSVQFYDLATHTGFSVFLPGANNQIFSGADVAVDPVHHVFLVAQPVSSTAPSGSSIHVYDESGNLLESLNGFDFSNVVQGDPHAHRLAAEPPDGLRGRTGSGRDRDPVVHLLTATPFERGARRPERKGFRGVRRSTPSPQATGRARAEFISASARGVSGGRGAVSAGVLRAA